MTAHERQLLTVVLQSGETADSARRPVVRKFSKDQNIGTGWAPVGNGVFWATRPSRWLPERYGFQKRYQPRTLVRPEPQFTVWNPPSRGSMYRRKLSIP